MPVRKEKIETVTLEDETPETKTPKKRGRSAAASRKTESVADPLIEEEYETFDEVAHPVYQGGGGRAYSDQVQQNTMPYREEPGLLEKLLSSKLRILEVVVFLAALAISAKYLLGTVWHPGETRGQATFIEPANPAQFPLDTMLVEGGRQPTESPGKNDQVRQDLVELGGMLLDLDKRVANLESSVQKLAGDVSTFSTDKKPQVKQETSKEKPAREKKEGGQTRKSGRMDNWRILGFSGTRVVIQTPNGSHFLRVGQALDGVTIESINATEGIIETSEGALRCTR